MIYKLRDYRKYVDAGTAAATAAIEEIQAATEKAIENLKEANENSADMMKIIDTILGVSDNE